MFNLVYIKWFLRDGDQNGYRKFWHFFLSWTSSSSWVRASENAFCDCAKRHRIWHTVILSCIRLWIMWHLMCILGPIVLPAKDETRCQVACTSYRAIGNPPKQDLNDFQVVAWGSVHPAGKITWHCIISDRVCSLHKKPQYPIRFCKDARIHDDEVLQKKSAKLSYIHFDPRLSKNILCIDLNMIFFQIHNGRAKFCRFWMIIESREIVA